MGRVAGDLVDSIRIHTDPNKLERWPEISKVNGNKDKCNEACVRRANQMCKCNIGNNWLAAVRLERILEKRLGKW